ncbi:MAG: hypothetical protein IJB73_02535 [Firmicutes bacterium]|nr:hypothetical protein [Bacillota bacterium]
MKKKTIYLIIFIAVLLAFFLLTLQSSGPNVPKEQSISGKECKSIVKQLTTPEYSDKEIKQMIESSVTQEELADIIKTPADIISLFNVIDYAEHEVDDNCNHFDEDVMVDWGFIWSSSKVYENRSGNCGGTSTIVNYLLKDDFAEQGYVEYSNHLSGGHIFNYFKLDDYYIMCDFAGPMDYRAGDIDPKTTQYMVYITTDPQDFGNYYVTHDSAFTEGSNEGLGALLFMYERQGVKLPKGRRCYEDHGNDYWSVLPEQYKDKYILLAERQGIEFEWEYFDESLWPEETKEYDIS